MSSLTIKEGSTEPIQWTISGTGITNLDAVSTAVLYAREIKASANEVDGVAMTVADSPNRIVEFDPLGNGPAGVNAFATAGTYLCYTKITWNDGDITKHPDKGFFQLTVQADYE